MSVGPYIPRGTAADGPRAVAVAPDGESWHHTGLDVVVLEAGASWTASFEGREGIVVPLAGAPVVDVVGDRVHALTGRPCPWGVTDVLYLPVGSRATIRAEAPLRVALPWARADVVHPVQHVRRDAVPAELRGAGVCSRQVNNFGTPGVLRADRIIACEVMQPGGNWSSYPPHKHDVDGEGETELEELYYYEVEDSPAGTEGFALQRVYSSSRGEIDVTEEVRTGDVVAIPYGYHGPTVAAPGHRLYYLNVMAGPRTPRHPDRAWLITDDPAHAWIRDAWSEQDVDARLPWR